jgi:hypothetical protein
MGLGDAVCRHYFPDERICDTGATGCLGINSGLFQLSKDGSSHVFVILKPEPFQSKSRKQR